MHARARYAAAAGLVVLSGALVGCSGEAAPQGSPAPSTSVASSATPTAPTLPAEAKGTSPQAAEAFVRHYVDLINYSLRTLDGKPMLEASAESCELCKGFARIVADVERRNGRFEGGDWRIRELQIRPHGVPRERNVMALVAVSEETIRYARKGKTTRYPQREASFNFIVREGSTGMTVVRILGGAR